MGGRRACGGYHRCGRCFFTWGRGAATGADQISAGTGTVPQRTTGGGNTEINNADSAVCTAGWRGSASGESKHASGAYRDTTGDDASLWERKCSECLF